MVKKRDLHVGTKLSSVASPFCQARNEQARIKIQEWGEDLNNSPSTSQNANTRYTISDLMSTDNRSAGARHHAATHPLSDDKARDKVESVIPPEGHQPREKAEATGPRAKGPAGSISGHRVFTCKHSDQQEPTVTTGSALVLI